MLCVLIEAIVWFFGVSYTLQVHMFHFSGENHRTNAFNFLPLRTTGFQRTRTPLLEPPLDIQLHLLRRNDLSPSKQGKAPPQKVKCWTRHYIKAPKTSLAYTLPKQKALSERAKPSKRQSHWPQLDISLEKFCTAYET